MPANELSDRKIEVFDYVNDYGVEKTAEKFGISENTVRRYCRKVNEALREEELDLQRDQAGVQVGVQADEAEDGATNPALDKQGRFYFYDPRSEMYVFAVPGETFRVDRETLRRMKALYSEDFGRDTAYGIQELCEEFDITRKMFHYIKLVRGWVHKSSRYLQEDFDEHSPEDLAEQSYKTYVGKEGRYHKLFHKKITDANRKLAEEARQKDWLMQRAVAQLNEVFDRPKPIPPRFNINVRSDLSDKTYILCLADWHAQLKIYADEMIHGMGYDKQTRLRLAEELLQQVYADVENHWQYKFRKAIFIEGGDGADGLYGETIAGTPRIHQDTKTQEAIDELVRVWETLVYGLYDLFGKVEVRYVPGNHVGFLAHVIWDRFFWRYQNFEDIVIHRHKKMVHSFVEGDNQFLLYHGKHPNSKRRAVNFKEGSKRDSDIMRLLMAHKKEYLATKNHYMLLGDTHAGKYRDNGAYEEYIIPSMSPPDQYAESINAFTRPGTLGFVVDDEQGIIVPRRYYFDTERIAF